MNSYQQQAQPQDTHSKVLGYLLWIFGFTGAHRFYYGKPVTGTIWFFTLGLLGIGWLIDLFLIPAMDREADLRFTAAFGRGRYVCPRNLAALASTEPNQQDLLAFLDDDLTPNNQEEQKRCARLKGDLDSYKWDGLRDHTDIAIDDGLWQRLSTDKASCLNRNCHYYRECPFFVARREIQEAEVVVANHALVMADRKSVV